MLLLGWFSVVASLLIAAVQVKSTTLVGDAPPVGNDIVEEEQNGGSVKNLLPEDNVLESTLESITFLTEVVTRELTESTARLATTFEPPETRTNSEEQSTQRDSTTDEATQAREIISTQNTVYQTNTSIAAVTENEITQSENDTMPTTVQEGTLAERLTTTTYENTNGTMSELNTTDLPAVLTTNSFEVTNETSTDITSGRSEYVTLVTLSRIFTVLANETNMITNIATTQVTVNNDTTTKQEDFATTTSSDATLYSTNILPKAKSSVKANATTLDVRTVTPKTDTSTEVVARGETEVSETTVHSLRTEFSTPQTEEQEEESTGGGNYAWVSAVVLFVVFCV